MSKRIWKVQKEEYMARKQDQNLVDILDHLMVHKQGGARGNAFLRNTIETRMKMDPKNIKVSRSFSENSFSVI